MSFVSILKASKFIQTFSMNQKSSASILPGVKSYYKCMFLLQTSIRILLKTEFLINPCCIIAK